MFVCRFLPALLHMWNVATSKDDLLGLLPLVGGVSAQVLLNRGRTGRDNGIKRRAQKGYVMSIGSAGDEGQRDSTFVHK